MTITEMRAKAGLLNFNTESKFLIQCDSPSKKYKFRVLSLSGKLLGYFKTRNDCIQFCEAN